MTKLTLEEVDEWAADKYNATISRMANQLAKTMRENEKMREALDGAPHTPQCNTQFSNLHGLYCNCWKMKAMEQAHD
jgi:hypothetical protein